MKTSYLHTERGQTGLRVIAILGLVLFIIGVALGRKLVDSTSLAAGLLGCFAFVSFMVWAMSSLTVGVDETGVTSFFGAGFFRRRISFSDVKQILVVDTSWVDGWGIHLTRQGWLHNVSIGKAVRFDLISGKSLAIGSHDPEALYSALTQALSEYRAENTLSAHSDHSAAQSVQWSALGQIRN